METGRLIWHNSNYTGIILEAPLLPLVLINSYNIDRPRKMARLPYFMTIIMECFIHLGNSTSRFFKIVAPEIYARLCVCELFWEANVPESFGRISDGSSRRNISH